MSGTCRGAAAGCWPRISCCGAIGAGACGGWRIGCCGWGGVGMGGAPRAYRGAPCDGSWGATIPVLSVKSSSIVVCEIDKRKDKGMSTEEAGVQRYFEKPTG